jgi:hypothetical protein
MDLERSNGVLASALDRTTSIALGAIEHNYGRMQGVGLNAGPVNPRLTVLP